MGLLQSAWLPLDLSAHCDAIILAGNILAGSTNYGKQYSNSDVIISYITMQFVVY